MLEIIHVVMSIQVTVERIGETIHTFELKRCMSNIIAMLKDSADLTLNICPGTDVQIIGEDVSRHGPQALRKTPNMNVMNAKHTVHLNNVVHHIFYIYITRRGFEQNVNCVAQDAPGVVEDEEADQHIDQRIEPVGVGKVNDYTGNDRADCGQHISHQMDKRGTQIEVM